MRASILATATADPSIRTANGVITVQLGPRQIFAALSADFESGLGAGNVEACVERLETVIRRAHPDIAVLIVKPQSGEAWRRSAGRVIEGQARLPEA